MAGTAPTRSTNRAILASGSMWLSDQIPMSPGVMRPCAVTAVASVNTRPAPPTARLPRWTRCQSLAKPSSLEYWHIGETAIRLRRTTPRMEMGSKRVDFDVMSAPFYSERFRAGGTIPVMNLTMDTPPDFSFHETAHSHGWRHLHPFGWDEDSRTL